MTYTIISTGSQGNAVILNGEILIDIGVSWKKLRPYVKNLNLVLLTHEHGDHFNPSTVRSLHRERPRVRFGCCKWMVWPLSACVGAKFIDVYEDGYETEYKTHIIGTSALHATIRAEPILHDVENCAYHIYLNGETIFYATDTGTLDGITAKNYNWYFIEENHTEDDIAARIAAKQDAGEFAYEIRAAKYHLSKEKAERWLAENAGPHSQYVPLHQHTERGNRNANEI